MNSPASAANAAPYATCSELSISPLLTANQTYLRLPAMKASQLACSALSRRFGFSKADLSQESPLCCPRGWSLCQTFGLKDFVLNIVPLDSFTLRINNYAENMRSYESNYLYFFRSN